jgi:hypothetical protein
MEKRSSKRIKTRHFVRIGEIPGYLNDVSDTGMRVSIAALPKTKKVDISIQLNGQAINLIGFVKWFIRRNVSNNYHQLGLTIKNPPTEYIDFVKNSS